MKRKKSHYRYVIGNLYSLTREAFRYLLVKKGWVLNTDDDVGISSYNNIYSFNNDKSLELRCNEDLVECVEVLGDKAGFNLKIVECPYGPNEGIEIYDYCGVETLQTIPEIFE